jgi:DNA invertase Pin-like site-specific DNA recombinase
MRLARLAADGVSGSGLSGAVSARPGLLTALETAQEGDTLTVWRIDRLTGMIWPITIQSNKCC